MITTSGQVQAAQGDESVVVANVAGVVSFRHPVTDGMSVSKGAPILNISAENMPDGDPVKRTRIAYETAKKEYERAAKLVKSQIISQKDFNAIKESYENALLAHFVSLAQAILYRGAGFEIVWPQFLTLMAIGGAFFTIALLRFRKTIGTMA